MMKVEEIVSEGAWSTYFNTGGSPSFLQSFEWGEMQKKLGYQILRLGIYNNGNLAATALIVKIRAKRGSMIFVPHGPVFQIVKSPHIKPVLQALKEYLVGIAKNESYSFIRIAPVLDDLPENRSVFKDLGFRTAPIYMHAERLWILDITKTENELMAQMRKTTRYSIRKAEKEGVVIEHRTDEHAVEDFWSIYKETASREGFLPFSKSFIKHEFESFHRTNNAVFLFGKHDGSYQAASLIIFTKSTGFYHQGASLHSKIPVAYLMQWHAIREAQKRGCTVYNFWGILQKGRTPRSWGGLTLFKQGFGGKQIDYVPTQDYAVSPRYGLSYLYDLYLKHRRGI